MITIWGSCFRNEHVFDVDRTKPFARADIRFPGRRKTHLQRAQINPDRHTYSSVWAIVHPSGITLRRQRKELA